jgi:CheY-specific phosphatase CheX
MSSLNALTTLVRAFGAGTLNVAKNLGLHFRIDREGVGPGIRTSSSCAAAVIGVVGESLRGSVTLLTDKGAFHEIIRTMSGGMIQEPSTSDHLSMSALGELANMICGSALKESARLQTGRFEITPPQMFTGDNLKSFPSDDPNVKYYTIPMVNDKGTANVYIVLGFR